MKIQSGNALGSKEDFDWELHKGHGSRTFRPVIAFPEAFAQPPTVVVSVTGFDIQDGDNARLAVRVVKTEHHQFQLEYKTWASTKVHQVKVSWIAYGT